MKTKLVIWSLVVLVATGIFFHGGCSTGTEGDRVWETKFSAMLHDSLVVLRNEYFSRLPVLVVNSRLASAWQLDTAGTFEFCGQAYDLSDAAFRERLQDELWYLYDRQGWLLTQAQRLGRYRNLIEAQLAIDTMPKDLTYLYVWESGLNPTAVSWAGATGISQFIQSTGRAFRLHISSQYDERKDPGPAITASVHYLKNLYGEFGDWLLVLASYNHGETAVRNRLAQQQVSRFIDLLVPNETHRYVFQVMAVCYIFKNGLLGNLSWFRPHDPLPVSKRQQVRVSVTTSLAKFSQQLGVDFSTFKLLNPHLPVRLAPGTYPVNIPVPG